MYSGIIVENSLTDITILNTLTILQTWQDGSWVLHKVYVTELQIKRISDNLAEGPWYTHFWDETKEKIIVVFKNKTFEIAAKNQETWQEAIQYGLALNIPVEQLDFLIDQDQ